MIRNFATAVLAMTTALTQTWAQSNNQNNQGWTRCFESDPDIAIPSCTAVIETHSESPTHLAIAFNNRGNAYYAKGDFDQAIEDYDEAIRRRPDFAGAFNNRGNAYASKHEYERAIEDLGEALRIARESHPAVDGEDFTPFNAATAWNSRGIAYTHIGDYDHAINDFSEAIRLNPDEADTYYNRGIAHNCMGDYDSAIADFDKSIRINPRNAFALYCRATARRNKGDVAGARADTAAALQIDPEIARKVGEMTVPLTPVTSYSTSSRSVPSCEALRDGRPPVAQAPSYVDEPIEQLKRMVPGLSGIRIDTVENASDGAPAMTARDKTASILNQTGAVMADLFHRMPNLIAKEEVKEPTDAMLENASPTRSPLGSAGTLTRLEIPITRFRTRDYTYRIVHKQTPTGSALDEFRTDAHDHPIDESARNAQRPSSVGFATIWLFFFPGNLQKSHFRYVGEQKIGGRETYVLAFAQIPGQEGLGAVVESSYGRCTTPMQGVAWIDQSTFRIVRMQTDLLTPLPGIQLNQLRSILNCGAVKIPARNLSLWLLSEVETTWQTANGAGEEFHTYSHYRLFQSTARILPADTSPPP